MNMSRKPQELREHIRRVGRSFRLGVDLDGVVIDHTKEFLRISRAYGYRLKPWQTNTNILRKVIPKVAQERIKPIVYTEQRGHESPVAGSLQALRALQDHIIIVSVQKEREAEEKLWPWLKKHGVLKYIPKSRIHIVRSRQAKLRRIKKLKPHFFIDDGLEVLEHLPQGVVPILFDPQGISRRLLTKKEIFVVRDWRAVRELFT